MARACLVAVLLLVGLGAAHGQGSLNDIKLYFEALSYSGLADEVDASTKAKAPGTGIVPVNVGFQALLDQAGVARITQLPKELVEMIILNHILLDEYTPADLIGEEGLVLTTALNSTLTVNAKSPKPITFTSTAGVTATVYLETKNPDNPNSQIYFVDQVLVPKEALALLG